MTFRRYTSPDEDSGRWREFPFRDGDVVVSTRSKHGTTWVQTIVLLLIHRRPDLPTRLPGLSPWVDHLVEPLDAVLARLEAQRHRRVVKTHTPLDGVPFDRRATYIVVARHPLDAAVSLYHQGDNIDRERMRRLVGAPMAQRSAPRPPVEQWLASWIDNDADPVQVLDSLPGVLRHLTDAWSRRDRDNVVLVHYADLLADLEGQMRHLAEALHMEPPREDEADLARAATFVAMRERASLLAPDAGGILLNSQKFFRRGTSGAAAELLDPHDLARYHERAAALAPPDLLAWLHR